MDRHYPKIDITQWWYAARNDGSSTTQKLIFSPLQLLNTYRDKVTTWCVQTTQAGLLALMVLDSHACNMVGAVYIWHNCHHKNTTQLKLRLSFHLIVNILTDTIYVFAPIRLTSMGRCDSIMHVCLLSLDHTLLAVHHGVLAHMVPGHLGSCSLCKVFQLLFRVIDLKCTIHSKLV